ncbi:16S rRNA (uracil1498-N3)-methyltransferase [Clostridium tetanomorphum]|uniref:Ribosomal RNA small subunit methyltransferase E n=1 Tax=Clostridium tetanomorphum TaxID=1553 RepID=A0A923EBJ2_CLOTT|nr:RsmE family RNA methyltransferase [Clostridium tetanomorphum]KAJ53856.1 16S ribosomal RNA methyltransferase RsmE [Clostridium tetanomorphum DSM 665]MBC2397370.1 16S rRNA (uracil(1498)-N(3))-methyltransferase [Clostridium tetanomorphum]MBP1862590.1 16S rRNA (uracil1498-N3)-methyltransferase [Clostridium tetanomorphum]NRS85569.1 16S rRNA (uracil1498-N3)-methyltransferase [Clostridium tetanomorphum]NRZ96420.1 16S rRNA (uracil1498-N3)-methyltransferase [Clostridium tetanomorphum]
MHKFFVLQDNIILDEAIIQGDDVKHIYKVLRLTEGTIISVNNCNGEEFLGEIKSIDKKEVRVKLKEKLDINNESKVEVYLFQGLPKSSKMDLIVQKNCELGVREITPIITERVVVKNELGEFKKLDRLARIALEASKQSKRTLIPKINFPISFDELLRRLKDMDLIVVPYENEQGFGIKNMINSIDKGKIRKVGVIIGPEGGFEKEEIEVLKDIGAFIVTLGPRILRTETAGFVSISLVMYELGDLGGNI